MRPDGRTAEQLRPITIERDFTTTYRGSAVLYSGETRLSCSASLALDVPRWLRTNAHGWVTAEYSQLPLSPRPR